jgi:hypothetical protein
MRALGTGAQQQAAAAAPARPARRPRPRPAEPDAAREAAHTLSEQQRHTCSLSNCLSVCRSVA